MFFQDQLDINLKSSCDFKCKYWMHGVQLRRRNRLWRCMYRKPGVSCRFSCGSIMIIPWKTGLKLPQKNGKNSQKNRKTYYSEKQKKQSTPKNRWEKVITLKNRAFHQVNAICFCKSHNCFCWELLSNVTLQGLSWSPKSKCSSRLAQSLAANCLRQVCKIPQRPLDGGVGLVDRTLISRCLQYFLVLDSQ